MINEQPCSRRPAKCQPLVEPITGLAETLYSAAAFQAFTLRWFWEDIACNGLQPVTVALCQVVAFLLVLINAF